MVCENARQQVQAVFDDIEPPVEQCSFSRVPYAYATWLAARSTAAAKLMPFSEASFCARSNRSRFRGSAVYAHP